MLHTNLRDPQSAYLFQDALLHFELIKSWFLPVSQLSVCNPADGASKHRINKCK